MELYLLLVFKGLSWHRCPAAGDRSSGNRPEATMTARRPGFVLGAVASWLIGAGAWASEPARAVGTLVIIGGHEDKDRGESILREFVRLAGGKGARLLVVTYPSMHPGAMEEDYRQ